MKNFNKYIALFFGATALFSCDPLSDEIKELEEAAPAPIENLTITLEDDDYELAIIDGDTSSAYQYKNFSSLDDVKLYVPIILKTNYPVLGAGSFAEVTYNFYQGGNAEASKISGADEYEFDDADYAAISTVVGESGFINEDSKGNVPDVLSANIADPSEGDVVGATFEYADVEYAGGTIHNAGFAIDLEGYVATSVVGDDQNWYQNSYQTSTYANMSGYSGGAVANEDWLVSPAIDLTAYSGQSVELTVDQTLNFLGGLNVEDDINIMISSDYSGDVSTATWSGISLSAWPAGDSWDPVVGTSDLSSMAGETIYIAFKYESTDSDAPNWQINQVTVKYGEATSVDTEETTVYFEYNGSDWEENTSAYALTASDYDAMGDGPGRYNNFSSSAEPEDYLPQFLAKNYPFAQDEDEMIVSYKYYDGSSTEVRADLYTYAMGVWTGYSSVIEQTLSFGHDGVSWVPDNTITVLFASAQWSVITALEGGDRGDNVSQYNSFYQGSNTTGDTYWSNEEILAILIEFCNDQYSSMEEGQKYLLQYAVYQGSGVTVTRSTTFIKVGDSYEELLEE